MTVTSLATLKSTRMGMTVTVTSMIARTLSLSRIQTRRRINLRPKTTTSKIYCHLFDCELTCLHRLSDDGSNMFVMSPELPRPDELFAVNKGPTGSVGSSKTAVQDTASNNTSKNQIAMRLRSLGSRHILVKDTAFKT